MTIALVTGAGGFAGSHLVALLRSTGRVVVAALNTGSRLGADGLSVHMDVTNQRSVTTVMEDYRPDEVYHLAGLSSSVNHDIQEYFRVNVEGTLNVCALAPAMAKVLVVTSGLVYGSSSASEDQALLPRGPYPGSKAAADVLTAAMTSHHIIRARPFNHTGPGQKSNFLLPNIVKQVLEIEAGLVVPVVEVGNLHTRRDTLDVRDVCSAYLTLMERGTTGQAYNVSRGDAYSTESLLRLVLREAGVQADFRAAERLIRHDELPVLEGNPARLRALGWNPVWTITETVRDMLAVMRPHVKA